MPPPRVERERCKQPWKEREHRGPKVPPVLWFWVVRAINLLAGASSPRFAVHYSSRAALRRISSKSRKISIETAVGFSARIHAIMESIADLTREPIEGFIRRRNLDEARLGKTPPRGRNQLQIESRSLRSLKWSY
jgi:hypothetical protein